MIGAIAMGKDAMGKDAVGSGKTMRLHPRSGKAWARASAEPVLVPGAAHRAICTACLKISPGVVIQT